jgi:hypothetical protein
MKKHAYDKARTSDGRIRLTGPAIPRPPLRQDTFACFRFCKPEPLDWMNYKRLHLTRKYGDNIYSGKCENIAKDPADSDADENILRGKNVDEKTFL